MLGLMAATAVTSATDVVVRRALSEENLKKMFEFFNGSGKPISPGLKGLYEKVAQKGEKIPDAEITEEVKEEILKMARDILEEQARPVYMGGITFLCEYRLNGEQKDELREVLTNYDPYEGENFEWEDEKKQECQEIVNEFVKENYGCRLNENEGDFCIGEDYLHLNLEFDDDRYYRLYNGETVRRLADAINQLLGDKYITGFTTY